jgi:hypothetical protein
VSGDEEAAGEDRVWVLGGVQYVDAVDDEV